MELNLGSFTMKDATHLGSHPLCLYRAALTTLLVVLGSKMSL